MIYMSFCVLRKYSIPELCCVPACTTLRLVIASIIEELAHYGSRRGTGVALHKKKKGPPLTEGTMGWQHPR